MKLSFKIAAIVTFALVCALLASLILVSRSVRSSVQKRINEDQRHSVVQTLDKVDRFIYERSIDTQIIASNDEITEALLSKDPEEISELAATLKNVKNFDAVWNSLTAFDNNGNAIVSTDKVELTTKLDQGNNLYKYYEMARNGQMSQTDLIKDPISGSPTAIYFSPIKSPDSNFKVVGVLVGKLAWPSVAEILNNIKGADVLLLNSKGIEVANNDNDEEAVLKEDFSQDPVFKKVINDKSKTGSFTADGFDNFNSGVLISYSSEAGYLKYGGNGWILLSSIPAKDAFAPIKDITIILSLILGSIMLITLILVLIFMRQQVSKPLKLLADAVEGISRGDWSKHVNVNKNDELGQLANAFNSMTSRLSLASDQLRQEKARLESSIKSLPLGFMLTDAKNKIITMNPALHIIIGLKKDADLNTKDIEVIRLLDMLLDKSNECLTSQKSVTHNFTTDSGRFLRIFISPVTDHSKIIGTVTLVEDITELKVMERSKEEFFSIASHELRTPLTAIRGNVDLIKQIYGAEVKGKDVNQMLDDIHSSSVRLIEIVNDFLDASRLEQGKIDFKAEPFDITTLIENIMYEMSAVLKERKLFFKFDKTLNSLPKVKADEDRVKQVLYNLIGNSVKFTEKGGIIVETTVEGKLMHIKVSDTGPGIPADKQALLFRKFQQAGNSLFTRDSTRGTGLGLYISKLLVEQMGGKLNFEGSKLGEGTTFGFTLPLELSGHHNKVGSKKVPKN